MSEPSRPGIFRLYPLPSGQVDSVYGDLELPEGSSRDPSMPYVCINMVSSLDGKISVDGRSGGIGSALDRETMRVLRSKVDAVMVGAGTIRSERISLSSEGRRFPEPLAIIVSSSGDVPLEENLIGHDENRTLVLTSDSASRERTLILSKHSSVLTFPENHYGHLDLLKVMRTINQKFQVQRLLVEGGPTLNHRLLASDLVEDLFLTIAPKFIGGKSERSHTLINGYLLPETSPSCLLASAHISHSELFLRYSVSDK